MKFIFRPLIASAVKHYGYAKRLASAVKFGRARSKKAIYDGYIFLAQRVLKDSVVVKVIDPPARWLTTGHYDYTPGATDPFLSIFFGLDRGYLTPAESWTPPDPILNITNAYSPLLTVTYFGGSFGGGFYYGEGRADWRGKYALVTSFSSDRNAGNDPSLSNYDPDTVYRLFFIYSTWATAPVITGEETTSVTPDLQMSLGISEEAIRSWAGMPGFRLLQNPQRWKDTRTAAAGIPRVETVAGVEHDTYTVVATCCNQVGNSVDSGFFVGRFSSPRVVVPPPRAAGALWGNIQLLSNNVDVDLRPQLDGSGNYRRNTIYDLGLLETDTKVIVVASSARIFVDLSLTWRTTATQVYTFDRITGSASVVLEYKTTLEEGSDALRRVNHCLNQVRYSVAGVPRTGLAAVRFDVTDEIVDGSIQLVIYNESGVAVLTGLSAAGYVPFWPKLHGEYTGLSFADDLGYYTTNQPSAIREVGPGRLGVLAASAAQVAAGGNVDWRLVILDANDFSFIEARGVFATFPDSTFIATGLQVISQEEIVDDVVVTPAVLMVVDGQVADGAHKLSRDGGMTWETVFNATNWVALYMGNGLHPVDLV